MVTFTLLHVFLPLLVVVLECLFLLRFAGAGEGGGDLAGGLVTEAGEEDIGEADLESSADRETGSEDTEEEEEDVEAQQGVQLLGMVARVTGNKT